MSGSDPLPEKEDPPTDGKAQAAVSIETGNERLQTQAKGTAAEVPQEIERDDFGLPIKTTPKKKNQYESSLDDIKSPVEGQTNGDSSKSASIDVHPNKTSEDQAPAAEPVETGEPAKAEEKGEGHDVVRDEKRGSKIAPADLSDVLGGHTGTASGWSHQALAPQKVEEHKEKEDEWQEMPAFAPYDIYNDDNKLVAKEAQDSDDEAAYTGLGGAGKGYTRVQMDDDAKSTTSMEENTEYLFKSKGTEVYEEDDENRDPLSQLQATKDLLTEGQRIAYVGVTRLCTVKMVKGLEDLDTTRKTKKSRGKAIESITMWAQKMMVRVYLHMDINSSGESSISGSVYMVC